MFLKKLFLLFVFYFSGFLVSFSAEPPAPLPTNLTILTSNEFVGRAFLSVADAIEGLTSLNIEKDGYVGTQALLKIRGSSRARTTAVYLDGELLNHDFEGQVDLSQIPINIVQRIEISRGGGSVSLGNEGASVVNIITHRPTQKGLVSRLGTGVGRHGVKYSEGQFLARSYYGDITYLGNRQEASGFMSNEDSKEDSHFLNFTRSFNGRGFAGGEYFYQNSRVGLGQGTTIPFSEWNSHLEKASSNSQFERRQNLQRARFTLVSPSIKEGFFYLTLSHQERSLDLKTSPGGFSFYDQKTGSQEADLRWQKKGFQTGIEAQQLKRNVFGLDQQKAFLNSAYILNKWEQNRWTFLPGVRYTHHNKSGSAWNPRLAILFSVNDQLSLSGTSQLSQNVPVFDELFISSSARANPNLKWESVVTNDVGFEWKPTSLLNLKGTVFHTRTKDKIEINTTSSEWENGGEEKVTGIETEFVSKWGQTTRYRNIILSGSWTLQKGEQKELNSNSWKESRLTPKQLAHFALDYALPRSITISNELQIQSEQFEGVGKTGLRIPSYAFWNARFLVQILTADLFFEVKNVTARRYADAIASSANGTVLSPQPGRTFWAGISIRFKD